MPAPLVMPYPPPLPSPLEPSMLTVPASTTSPTVVALSKRRLPTPSAVYPVLWQFAAERQRVYKLRVAGHAPPWTADDILLRYRFTNPYRAADRVSQALIRMVYCEEGLDAGTIFLRTMLFKIFNKTATWEAIVARLGLPRARSFDVAAHDRILTELRAKGTAIYSGAYIMPSGGAGTPKHRMHLELLARMLADRLPDKIEQAKGLHEIYNLLLAYPSLGPFLAFQYTIDLAYTPLVRHDESEFVVAGPGALDGLSKCFESLGDYTPAETIMWLTEAQHIEFARLGIAFDDLWGRSLQPIDVQNLFCEVSKYTRVSHPAVAGVAGRTRIKQQFEPAGRIEAPYFPPKWGINASIERWMRERGIASRGGDGLPLKWSARDTPACGPAGSG